MMCKIQVLPRHVDEVYCKVYLIARVPVESSGPRRRPMPPSWTVARKDREGDVLRGWAAAQKSVPGITAPRFAAALTTRLWAAISWPFVDRISSGPYPSGTPSAARMSAR